jgi:hypothetical protein
MVNYNTRLEKSMAMIQAFCKDRVISNDIWRKWSPVLINPDFFLWGYVNEQVCHNTKLTTDTLKKNIAN